MQNDQFRNITNYLIQHLFKFETFKNDINATPFSHIIHIRKELESVPEWEML